MSERFQNVQLLTGDQRVYRWSPREPVSLAPCEMEASDGQASPRTIGLSASGERGRSTEVCHVRAGELNEIGRQTRRERMRRLVPPVARGVGSAAVSSRDHGTGNPHAGKFLGGWLMEVQISYFEVQIADFASVPPDVAMSTSTRGGPMTAPTAMQIAGFQGDVIAPDHDGYDEARAVRDGTVDLFYVNQNIAPAKRGGA